MMSSINKVLYPEYNIEAINNVMSLRKPQKNSLKILDNILDEIDLTIKQSIKEIIIQNGITSIKDNVLNQFTSLETIEYNGVKSIDCSDQTLTNTFVGIKVNEEYEENSCICIDTEHLYKVTSTGTYL